MILPSVIAAWPGFSEPLEGRVLYPYLDIKGLVTVGVGNLIDPVAAALRLPWHHVTGRPATREEVLESWRALKAQKALARRPHRFAAGVTSIRLADAAVDELVAAKLASNARELCRHYPDFPSFPADAQLAILSMAWAVGPAFPKTWPRFSTAVRARRWDLAAASCKIRDGLNTPDPADDNLGIVPRNGMNAAHLAEAVSDLAVERPELVHGPATLAALRAGWKPSGPYRAAVRGMLADACRWCELRGLS